LKKSKQFLLFLKLFRESYIFAIHAIIVNKLRTILSLLGITIGIFAIISVLTVFDSMENYVRDSIESLGENVLFITKTPWIQGPDTPWWEYIKRPNPKLQEMKEIQKRSNAADMCAFEVYTSRTIKYKKNSIEGGDVLGVSSDYDKVISFDLEKGRFFSPIESYSGKNVTVVGSDIAKSFFGESDPIGKKVQVFGRKMVIIGVIKKEGEDAFGVSSDNRLFVPINFLRNVVDINSRYLYSHIIVKGKEMVSNEELKDELTGILRSLRKLKPTAKSNFAINERDILIGFFDEVFGAFAMAGWIIGGFSLLVGGFGIANIMFVSVRERTNQIGIQKSLGAKNYFILLQFIFEAVFLSLIGGIVGLLFVFLGTSLISAAFDMNMSLSEGNIFTGLFVSFIIGLVSGIVPAYIASRLNPVDAIRTTG